MIQEDNTQNNSDEILAEKADLAKDFQVAIRLIKHSIRKLKQKFSKKYFTHILIITTGNVPFDYIAAMKKQYPDKTFSVLVPIINEIPKDSEKICSDYEYFLQNKKNTAQLYKFYKNTENVDVYGIYSESFSRYYDGQLFDNIKQISPFIKSARFFVQKLNPDIVHAIDLPYFLGIDFEKNFKQTYRVVETISDFSKYDNVEPLWMLLNCADKVGMKRLCKDKIIRNCLSKLFNIEIDKHIYKIRDCLELIYENYIKFRSSIDKSADVEENAIFHRMNTRILKLFPQIKIKDSYFCNIMHQSLKRSNYWSVFSKTYYDYILENEENSGNLYQEINNTKTKSDYVNWGIDLSKNQISAAEDFVSAKTDSEEVTSKVHTSKVFTPFSSEDFRENKPKNKQYLIKEFSQGRILTKFTDSSLFLDDNYKIYGYLENLYDTPLIFCSYKPDIDKYGIDIAIKTILKLFELNKNVQVIFNVPDGARNSYIKRFIDFCKNNGVLNGRWLFIDGKINLSQFFASSDITLMPYRKNIVSKIPLMALNYGCIPVFSRQGILNDYVKDIFDDITEGCGFKSEEYSDLNEEMEEEFFKVSLKGVNFYKQNHASWNLLIKNAMSIDTGWKFNIVEKYNNIYEQIL